EMVQAGAKVAVVLELLQVGSVVFGDGSAPDQVTALLPVKLVAVLPYRSSAVTVSMNEFPAVRGPGLVTLIAAAEAAAMLNVVEVPEMVPSDTLRDAVSAANGVIDTVATPLLNDTGLPGNAGAAPLGAWLSPDQVSDTLPLYVVTVALLESSAVMVSLNARPAVAP